jgi:hypothetical protein
MEGKGWRPYLRALAGLFPDAGLVAPEDRPPSPPADG